MFFDGHHRLLRNETVPRPQRLGVIARIGIVIGHITTHDVRGITGNIQSRAETVLVSHTNHVFGVDCPPLLSTR